MPPIDVRYLCPLLKPEKEFGHQVMDWNARMVKAPVPALQKTSERCSPAFWLLNQFISLSHQPPKSLSPGQVLARVKHNTIGYMGNLLTWLAVG